MFAYHLPDGLPAGSRTVWSQLSLQPLTAQPLTPFSYSILDEVAKSAWYHYFDELGFEPMPRARVLRQQQGRAYLNLTLSAQRDVEGAAVEPLCLAINGQPFALVKWEKPSFLAGLKLGRNRKKIDQLLAHYTQAIPAVTQKAAAWYQKTQELRWTQADILQVMEEVERVSIDSFKIFFAARHHLELLYNRFFWLTQAKQPFSITLPLLQQALGAIDGLYEQRMAEQALALGDMATADGAALEAFLQQYGHRSVGEGEIGHVRWQEEPALIFASLQAYRQKQVKWAEKGSATQQIQPLLDAVAPADRKNVQAQLQQLRQLLLLQSQALHAFAYIAAGTRRWALAAAKEAQADHRLLQVDDVFFFQLEEVKQMMTGEWNISSRQEIQRTCVARRAEYSSWQKATAPMLLIGDSVAAPVDPIAAAAYAWPFPTLLGLEEVDGMLVAGM